MSSGQELRTGNFFLVVPPGLEMLALEELQEKWPVIAAALKVDEQSFPAHATLPGGVEILGLSWQAGCLLNLVLKIPTRILLRLAQFKCRDFPKLFNKVRKFDWSPLLGGPMPEVEASSHSSRLIHQGRIAETVLAGIASYYKAKPAKKWPESHEAIPPKVYARFVDDDCVLSIDTSGESLYKRWPGKVVGRASVRENLAAALYFLLKKQFASSWRRVLVVDPVCGSGTLLAEAASWNLAHSSRAYGFAFFPYFRSSKMALNFVQDFSLALQTLQAQEPAIDLWGFDQDAEVLAKAQANYPGLKLDFYQHDLYRPLDKALQEKVASYDAVCLFMNPPYGKRLALDGKRSEFYRNMLAKLQADWHPYLISMLVPGSLDASSLGRELKLEQKRLAKFKNGGYEVAFQLLSRGLQEEKQH